jgi:hypothetical protein
MIPKLDDSNLLLYAAKHYNNPQCFDTIEFYEDLNRLKYLKRLFKKYKDTGELKERLILNHIVILVNVFGPEATSRMLFLKLNGFEVPLKPFLIYLSILPERVYNIGVTCKTINTVDIAIDMEVVKRLRAI